MKRIKDCIFHFLALKKGMVMFSSSFKPLNSVNPLMNSFSNSEDPDEMQHNGYTLFVKVKKIFRQKNQFFENYNPTPLDM